ncbi:MAG: RNA methyltransferase [Eubacteriales bacterium]|nr:RNA methyltransferase [Eubacteriales bacterium]
MIITSPANEHIKQVKRLDKARYRRELGVFIAEGPHLVEEALNAGRTLREVYMRDDFAGALADRAARQAGRVFVLGDAAFRAISRTEAPQGILALVEGTVQPFAPEKAPGTLSVVLDGVQDPGNVGTILRTAAAVNAGFVLLGPGCADPLGDKAVRASMGAVFRVPLYESDDLANSVAQLAGAGWHTQCGHLRGTDFFARRQYTNEALVIGSEGAGVSDAVAQACAHQYRLPMAGQTESLNAAVAAGIMLYDLWRGRENAQPMGPAYPQN